MTIFHDLIKLLAGYREVTISENERMLVLRDGKFDAILSAGKHRLPFEDVQTEMHDPENLFFMSQYENLLTHNRPDLAEDHLTEFRAEAEEVVILLRDDQPARVLTPEMRTLAWNDAGIWTVERHQLTETMAVSSDVARRLRWAGLGAFLIQIEVAEGHTGLLTVDGVQVGQLNPGLHAFWNANRNIVVKQIDLRQQSHEVKGQEILTKDRVTIRVNLSAEHRVVDPVKAVGSVKDFNEALHQAMQLAFRKTLGALTLDRLLAEKVSVDAEAAEYVRTKMAEIGIEVGEIALKDVILPGEMREILTAVVAAEKQAEANVIRRWEETNATRSLLNTAKVMAENPVMLRLKELEALETIAGKVEKLTVHNGTEGLMTDLVKLRG
ncbi:MAG: slipin family protein [Ruegeria sp.]